MTTEFSYFGLDVSRHQGTLNWDTIAAHEPKVEFVAIRAGVSWGYEDGQFAMNWREAHRVGIPCTAYHVLYPDQPIERQVDNFKSIVDSVGIGYGQLPMIADIEVHRNRTKIEIAEAVEKYTHSIDMAFGLPPIIYTAKWFMDGYVDPSFIKDCQDDHWWWIANYPTNYGNWKPGDGGQLPYPLLPEGLHQNRVIIHQYSEKGIAIGGTSSSMDYNLWLKSPEFFYQLSGTQPTELPTPEPCCEDCECKQQIEEIRKILGC